MTQGSFTAQVEAWAAKSQTMLTAVHREAAQRVISLAQQPVGQGGNMPVDTGFLRASLVVTLGLDLPPTRAKPDGAGAYGWSPAEVTLAIANAESKDPITAVWTANYARPVEYGGENRLARRFVGLAAQRWQQVVAEVVGDVKARYGG